MTNKYGAKKCEEDGYQFASLKERSRYRELKLLVLAGKIGDLQVHPSWVLAVNEERIGKYTADFQYRDLEAHGAWVVEDCKGGHATKTEAYRLRKKLMKALHDIEIREV